MDNDKIEWTFKKERHKTSSEERIFLCGGEGEFADYKECALILGKIYSLFGEPTLDAFYDCSYTYEIIAEAPGKETANLTIEEYNNAAAIIYSAECESAAQALAKMINSAEPADYEYNIKGMESFQMITYFARDGKAGCRIRSLTIKEIFNGNPSPEDIAQFIELGYKLE
ncbi:MAG: hypothetical protein HDT42_11595 [Ruminococcaceae bacterium]|nr:hypothetical protein [Oscillospiraceae bacterium]